MTLIRNIYITDPSTGDQAEVNSDGQLHVVMQGKVCTSNSTSTPLGAGNTYTGTSIDHLSYATVLVYVYSDVASATDGLSVEFSTDETNWDVTDVFTIPAATGKTFSFQPSGQYYRVRYTNGGAGQSTFRLQTTLKKSYVKPSSHRIADAIISDDDAELVKAVLTGEDENGTFQNVQTTVDGNLTISDNSSGLAVAQGLVSGASFIHKFGKATDFDTADGVVTIWDGANDGLLGGGAMSYTYSSSADIDTISSSSNSDTVDIEVQGLDTNLDLVTQTVTLTGQTDASLSTALKRVFRMKNVGASDLVGDVYLRTNGSGQASGVPSTANTVRSIINNGNNQTLMAIYTIPTGKTGYMRSWYASTAGASKSSNYGIRLFARPSGQVFQLKHDSAISDSGTSSYNHNYVEPEVFSAGTDIELRVEMFAAGATSAAVSGGFDIVLVDD